MTNIQYWWKGCDKETSATGNQNKGGGWDGGGDEEQRTTNDNNVEDDNGDGITLSLYKWG